MEHGHPVDELGRAVPDEGPDRQRKAEQISDPAPMNNDRTITHATRVRSRRLPPPLVGAAIVAVMLTACAGGDAMTSDGTDPSPTDDSAVTPATEVVDGVDVENRSQLGPHASDSEREMALTVDSIQAVGDDILLRVRVANDSDDALAIGAEDTFYAPLVILRDDLDNDYPARAVEPAGVYRHSIGHLDLRLDGPLDPDATEFTVELTTERGPLETDAARLPSTDAVRWWTVESETRGTPEFADLPHLPDLIHATISNDGPDKSMLAFDEVDDPDE